MVNLVPDGGDGHEYEPTLQQIEAMLGSKMVVLNGLGLEHYKEKLSEELTKNNVPFLLLAEEYDEIIKDGVSEETNHEEEHSEEHHEEEHQEEENSAEDSHSHGGLDPHTWLSPKVMSELAKILAEKLGVQAHPEAQNFIKNLENLDTQFASKLQNCSSKELVTSHEAFGYLARDYGLVQVPVAGIEPDMEPAASDIAKIITLIQEKNIQTIFTESLVSTKFTDTITAETGVQTLELHALETLTPEDVTAGEDYISLMTQNLERISIGLDCK